MVNFTEVEEYKFSSTDAFQEHIHSIRKPIIIRNVGIGTCTNKWSVEYLSEVIGEQEVKVHVTPVRNMSFLQKNFCYKTLKFSDFIQRASNHVQKDFFLHERELYYLRSIGFDKRGREVSDIKKQFPGIASEIEFPQLYDEKDFFSSVFRISSSGVQVWTHYDIVDNMLIQVRGEKRVILFPPTEAKYLYLRGDKSEVLDIDEPNPNMYPLFHKALRYECILKPGEILFIPALWFHNTIAGSFSISVNVFWKNLPHELYDPSDVYGNKELIPAAKALSMVEKGLEQLKKLPEDYKKFYIQRAILLLEKESKDDRINKELYE